MTTAPTTRKPIDPCLNLHWYYNDCAGAVSGLKSSHETLVAMAQGGSAANNGYAPDGPQESPRAMRAAADERPMRATLAELSPLHQRVLSAHYTRRSYGDHDVRYPDAHAAVVLLLAGGIWPKHDREGLWIGKARAVVIEAQEAYRVTWRHVQPQMLSERWANAMRADTAHEMRGGR